MQHGKAMAKVWGRTLSLENLHCKIWKVLHDRTIELKIDCHCVTFMKWYTSRMQWSPQGMPDLLNRQLASNMLPLFCVTLPTETSEVRTHFVTVSLSKPRKNAEAILKTYELLICRDVRNTAI
jgi:hypothetical protein